MTENKQEIVLVQQPEYDGLVMVVSPREAMRRLDELRAFVKTVMVPGIDNDYAAIPGTKKKTLLQPGAQKLCEVYGLAQHFEDVEVIKDWDKPIFYFRKRCVLTMRRDGRFICDGVGSCNSREDKYGYRWVNEEDLPAGVDPKTLKRKSRETHRGMWVQYRIPNDDVFSLVNTMEKMACKRALIHAVQAATRSADLFTQDVEDQPIPDEAYGKADAVRSWEGEDRRTEAEKVTAFVERISEAQDEPAVNAIAAELAKSDLPMSAGAPLRRAVQDKLAILREAKKQSKAKAEPKPAETPPKTTPDGFDPHGDPEPPAREGR